MLVSVVERHGPSQMHRGRCESPVRRLRFGLNMQRQHRKLAKPDLAAQEGPHQETHKKKRLKKTVLKCFHELGPSNLTQRCKGGSVDSFNRRIKDSPLGPAVTDQLPIHARPPLNHGGLLCFAGASKASSLQLTQAVRFCLPILATGIYHVN